VVIEVVVGEVVVGVVVEMVVGEAVDNEVAKEVVVDGEVIWCMVVRERKAALEVLKVLAGLRLSVWVRSGILECSSFTLECLSFTLECSSLCFAAGGIVR